MVGYAFVMNTPYAYVFTSLLVAYITVWAGVTNYHRTFIIRGGDYSYGMYLYHMTLQQVLVSLGLVTWYAPFIVTVPVVTMIAGMSWNFVEKPALSLSTYLKRSDLRQAQAVDTSGLG